MKLINALVWMLLLSAAVAFECWRHGLAWDDVVAMVVGDGAAFGTTVIVALLPVALVAAIFRVAFGTR